MSDVFALLDKLSKTGSTTVEEARIKEIEPDPSLIHAWEPDYMDGYEISVAGGHTISSKQIWDAFVAGENILFVGPSGCGKSTLAFHLLDKANESTRAKNRDIFKRNLDLISKGKSEIEGYFPLPYPLSHYSFHEETRSAELIGDVSVKINDDGTRQPYMVLGSVIQAWTQGHTWIGEEIDFAPPGVLGQLHQFFDGRTNSTTVYINGPQRICKNKQFRAMATANTKGHGENQLEYSGTQVMNRAFMNRFTYVVNLSWLPSDREEELVHNRTGLRNDVLRKMIAAAKQTRDAHEEGLCDVAITTRDVMSWSRECTRAEVRNGKDSAKRMDLSAYWAEIAVPSASPTFLNRIHDQNTIDKFSTYLEIR